MCRKKNKSPVNFALFCFDRGGPVSVCALSARRYLFIRLTCGGLARLSMRHRIQRPTRLRHQ